MPSYNLSFSLDVVTDRDLIDRLVPLQERKEASAEIRIALREHFGQQVNLSQVLDELKEIHAMLSDMLSRGGEQVQAHARMTDPVVTVGPSLPTQLDAATVSEIEQKLNRTLARFG